jgi:hypothetical protein
MFAYKPDMSLLFDVLKQHLSTNDLQSVQEIATEIDARIRRFRVGWQD